MKSRYIIAFLLCAVFFNLDAQSSKKKSELERLKRAAQEKIAETSRMLTETGKNVMSSLNALNLLNDEIAMRRGLIKTINNEITLIEEESKSLSKEISELERELELKKKKYGEAMRSIYSKRSGIDEVVFVLSAQTFSQTWSRMRYLKEYSDWRKRQAHEISLKQASLVDKKASLEKKRVEKEKVAAERKNETEELRGQEKKQQTLVANLQKKKKELEKELKTQQATAKNLDNQIQKLIEEEARKSAARKNTQTATKGGYAMTKEETVISGSFEKNKGRLPFPITGSGVIIGKFGTQQHPQLKHVVTNNSGIEIKAKSGAEARCVYDGEVVKVILLPGANSAVIVRHGNYMSVYSNLGTVYVKAGDKVSTRQSIGKIFSDDSGETKMQFQIWKESTKLNPAHWVVCP